MKKIFILLALVLCFSVEAEAMMLDFGDNIPLSPGLHSLLYLNNYSASRSVGSDGKKAAALDMSWNVGTLRPLYYFKLLDRTAALTLYVPFGTVEARNSLGKKDRSSGLGDLIFNPGVFLYENPKSGTYLSVWENVNLPTGDWSKERALAGGPNLGLHTWFFEHQITLGQTLGKLSLDLNLNYYQRLKERSTSLRSGDSAEAEAVIGYGITDKLRIGSYIDYWADMKSARIDGNAIANSQRKFFAVGPSVSYGTAKWALHFRFAPEVWAVNGPKGCNTWLRLYYAF